VRRPSGRALGQTPSYDRVKRRSIIVALAALAVASKGTASAQQASPKIPRVGILAPAETDKTAFFVAFRSGLRDLGWVEGRNIILEFRLAHFDWTLLPRLAQDLVNLPVDVIVTSGGGAARIAMEATSKIPIVTIGVDPALFGLVESLARPRVNVTGFSLMSPELTAKRLEILRTTFPHISTVAVLVNTANPASKSYLQLTEDAARSLGLPIVTRVEADSVEALLAIQPAVFSGASSVVVLQDGLFWNHRRDLLALVNTTRLPAIYAEREFADDGGLISYGVNISDSFRRAAGYVDRILKGATPGDLPIQEPVKFDFIINLKTAKALGLTVPPSILARADEVIE
jgi:putative tryptophan/tyrosine transport system substrate-binding protein